MNGKKTRYAVYNINNRTEYSEPCAGLVYSPQELLPRQVEQDIEKAFEEIKAGRTKRFNNVEALIEELTLLAF